MLFRSSRMAILEGQRVANPDPSWTDVALAFVSRSRSRTEANAAKHGKHGKHMVHSKQVAAMHRLVRRSGSGMHNDRGTRCDARTDRSLEQGERNNLVQIPIAMPLACLLLSVMAFCPARAEDGKAKEADPPPPATPEQLEFFESKVRPILVEHCYECHAADSKKVQAGLRLD